MRNIGEALMKKAFLTMMMAVLLVFGMTVVGCEEDSGSSSGGDGGGGDIMGTYSGTMDGQEFTLTITSSNWTISAAGFSDSGTYILNGNTATLISNTETTEVGTATINENTITIVLNDRSGFSGTYTATKIGTGASSPAEAFTSLAEALAYLDSQPTGGINASNPVLLKVNINLSDSTEGWFGLVTALASKNKYVALDLSDSGVTDGEFNSGINGADKVKAKIVSLVLPDSATALIGGSTALSSGIYASLKTVSGANITSIGTIFSGCTSLITASFPKVTSVESSAFSGCTALATVSFPEATSISFSDRTVLIEVYAPKATSVSFSRCTSLTTLSFPEVTSIGTYAFNGCTSLTSVSAPKVTRIGYYAFAYSGTESLTITMGAVAPTVGGETFTGVTGTKNVTVRVPSGATGYDEAWQEAFKGLGSYGGGTGTVNENINLVVEYY
jgi:hypothetical protein